jgi:HEPN domain-containing protein
MSNADPAAERDAEVRRWLQYAQQDLRGAEAAVRIPGFLVPRHVCYLAQQAAEKALKAVYVYRGVPYKRTHDLDVLRNLIPDPEAWSITRVPLNLAALSVWATDMRYPGEAPEAEETDIPPAVDTARTVYDLITADFRRHGLVLPPDRRRTAQGPPSPQLPL